MQQGQPLATAMHGRPCLTRLTRCPPCTARQLATPYTLHLYALILAALPCGRRACGKPARRCRGSATYRQASAPSRASVHARLSRTCPIIIKPHGLRHDPPRTTGTRSESSTRAAWHMWCSRAYEPPISTSQGGVQFSRVVVSLLFEMNRAIPSSCIEPRCQSF